MKSQNTHYYLLLAFLLAMVSINTARSQGIPRLLQVNALTEEVTIKNFGDMTIDISSYWFCSLIRYAQLSNNTNLTVTSGSLNLAAGATVTLSFTGAGGGLTGLDEAGADLGLYNTNSFANTSAMDDFVKWINTSDGVGRTSVAIAKGIWGSGQAVPVSSPYDFTGSGTDFGLIFWKDPETTMLTPLDGAMNVAVSTNLEVTFDENIQTGSGNITIKKSSDDSEVEAIDVASPAVTVSNAIVTVNPSSDLPDDEDLYVQIDNTAIEDLAGNTFAGISDNTTWNFTTVDLTDPVISALSPMDETANVSVAANLVIDFDESVQAGAGNITIKKLSDNSDVEVLDVTSLAVTVSNDMVTVDPTSDLKIPD